MKLPGYEQIFGNVEEPVHVGRLALDPRPIQPAPKDLPIVYLFTLMNGNTLAEQRESCYTPPVQFLDYSLQYANNESSR